jgi:hypothetical protein
MRTFVVFALLALAVSAFDPQAYFQGFTQQFGFEQTQVQDLDTCFVGIAQLIGGVKADLQAHDLNAVLQTLQGVQVQLASVCGAWEQDITQYAIANSNGQTPKQIFEQYGPQIIQQVATWANYLAAGQDLEAGQTEAYIIQILMGAQQPTVIPAPQYDWSKYQQMNQDVFIQQYLGGLFNTLGLGQEVDIDAILNCVHTMEGVFQGLDQVHTTYVTADFGGKLDAIQTGLDNVIQGLKSCQAAIQADALLLVPVYEAFVQNPVGFLLHVLDNTATNLPELINMVQQEQIDVFEGNYTAAGVVKAERMQTVFNGIVDFAN